MLRSASSVLTLYLFWLALSGIYTPFLLVAGLGSALAAAWLAHRMDLVDHEGHPIHLGPAATRYWPWLGKEIAKSAWDVTKVVLSPRLPIAPGLVRFAPTQRTDVGLVTHANSITLTPGTISIEVGPHEFLVHALTTAGAEGVCNGDMDARVTRFEAKA